MVKEQILKKIRDKMERCDIQGMSDNVDELLKVTDDEDAMRHLSVMLSSQYNTFKADSTAKLMEIIIRDRPNLSMFNFPVNDFFQIAVLCGSPDLYDCYIEEAIEPFLKGKPEEEVVSCYLDLYGFAYQFTEDYFLKYRRCIKGMDYNGAFGRYEKNDNVALINQEDYEILNDVVEYYNAIVGRRDILADLIKKSDFSE